MLNQECLSELQTSWLPHITDQGLNRVIDLLEKGSALLIHGSFTRAMPMGCLATQVAWNHPHTAHLTLEAGICWLNRVAGLNPATSHVIREWDRCGAADFEMRIDLLDIFKTELSRRRQTPAAAHENRVKELVEA